jgi:L-histidine Nalpha-methyltransferase
MPDDSLPPASEVGTKTAAYALEGLSRPQKMLPAKLFYDEEGCRLFYRITELPEYYLTRTELALLRRVAPEINGVIAAPAVLVEYGASDETKASILLDQGTESGQPLFAVYVPIDVAAEALARLRDRLCRTRPGLAVRPISADFLGSVALDPDIYGMKRLGFFPGSTIGNLDPAQARRFLSQAYSTLGEEARMLVGVDLRKDPAIMVPAYDDAEGITAAFNLNLLARLNREAAADFDLRSFSHRAVWNDVESRIEMHLVSRRPQMVRLAGHAIRFAQGETIHTESSYKHTPERFAAIAEAAGWRPERIWTDPDRLFSLHLLRR